MNLKQLGCNFEGCTAPHRRNGYCANHSQKFKRGTLYTVYETKLCSVEGCNSKHYCKEFCNRHYRQLQRQEISLKVSSRRTELDTGNIDFEYKDGQSWARAVKKYFKDICMICNWDEAGCDAHHIVAKANQGHNVLTNAAVLCPNCHRKAHENKISVVELQNINKIKIENIQI